MKISNPFLVRLTAILALLMVSVLGSAQDYEIRRNYNGLETQLYDQALNTEAKRLKDFLAIKNLDFHVVGHSYYHILNFTTDNSYFDKAFDCGVESEGDRNDAYVLIAKNIKDQKLDYRVNLVLPSGAPYDTITVAEKDAIEADVLSAVVAVASEEGFLLSDNPLAEIAGLEVLRTYMEQIDAGTFSIGNIWQKGGWNSQALDPTETFTPTTFKKVNVAVSGSSNRFYDFAGLEVTKGNNTQLLRDVLQQSIAAASGPDSVFAGLNHGIIVTSELTTRTDMTTAENYFEDSPEKFMVWCHMVGDSMYTKANNSLTLAETENLANYYFEVMLREWYPEQFEIINAAKDDDESLMKSASECTEFNQWGKKCLLPFVIANPIIPQFQSGVMIGLLDGLIGTIYMIYQAADGAWKKAKKFFSGIVSYAGELWDHYQKNQTMWSVFEKAGSDVKQAIEKQWKDVVKTYEALKTLVSALDFDKIKTLLGALATKAKTWLGDFLQGEAGPAYDVGVIAFEVVLAVFTGGGSAAVKGAGKAGAKVLPKILKFLQDLNVPGGDGFKRLMDIVFGAAKKVTNGVPDNPVAYVKNLLCRLGIGACFTAGTPVMMSSGLVPIDSVQLLDYSLTHQTINKTSDPETLDPYTSVQQLERDLYEIDSVNWYEVVFQPQNTTSYCKMALHSNWMRENGIDSVGQYYYLNLPEQGITGLSYIASIKHVLPPKRPLDSDLSDEYGLSPITSIFVHETDNICELQFDKGSALGVTYNHPIYSITAKDWRLAGELFVGEEVLLKGGSSFLVAKKNLVKKIKVWNLEIQNTHNYLVGDCGIVVHNNYGILESIVNAAKNIGKNYNANLSTGDGFFNCAKKSKALRKHLRDSGVENPKSKRIQYVDPNGNPVNNGVIGWDELDADGKYIKTHQIANTGYHEYTILNGKVFDNISPNGIDLNDFLKRFQLQPGLKFEELDIFD